MHKRFSLAFAILTLFCLPAAADIIQAHPAIWHVKNGKGGEVTLFGSFHVLPANLDWLTPEIVSGLQHANLFVFEAPTDRQSQHALDRLMNTEGQLPDGQSLRALLPPESQAQFDTVLTEAHLKASIADREKPWLLSMQLRLANTMNKEFYPDAGVDYVLMDWANAHGAPVRYLETVDQQFAMLLPPNNDLNLDAFAASLKNWDHAPNTTGPMVEAWSDGDVAKLGALIDASFANYPEARQKLLTDRNKTWAQQIEKMIADGHNVFITVGAAHLSGPDGVPALLRADGLEVDGP